MLSKVVFSVALIIILTMNLNLFTSKVAVVLCSDSHMYKRIKDISIIFLGNALTCMFFGFLFSFMSETHARDVWETKLQTDVFIAFYKAILVGFLMQIAATCKHDFVTIGAVLLFLGISGEHSVANIAYMSIARAFSWESLIYICISIIGNTVGAIIIYLLNKESKVLDFKK